MPTEVEVRAGPTTRPENEAIDRMMTFLASIQQNSRSIMAQLDQIRQELLNMLEVHPSIGVMLANNKSLQRFLGRS